LFAFELLANAHVQANDGTSSPAGLEIGFGTPASLPDPIASPEPAIRIA
jgi:hypothetical protein